VAFGARLADVFLVGWRLIFQDTDDAVRIIEWTVAINAGGNIRVTLGQLLSVDTLEV